MWKYTIVYSLEIYTLVKAVKDIVRYCTVCQSVSLGREYTINYELKSNSTKFSLIIDNLKAHAGLSAIDKNKLKSCT